MKHETLFDHGCYTRKSSGVIRQNISRTWVNEVSFSCGVLVSFVLKKEVALMCLPFTFSFKSTPPGLRHLLGRLSQNPGESAEEARRRFYRRVFGILWVSLDSHHYSPSQPSFQAHTKLSFMLEN